MSRILARAAVPLALCLALAIPAIASAHHVDAVTSKADCNGVTAQFVGFNTSDGPVNWIVTIDGAPNRSGAFNAFTGNKTFTQAYSPGPLTGPQAHTVIFRADWPTRGSNNSTFTRTVTGCPAATPKPPTPTPPCPNQPPTAPCNCPPGPAGPAGPAGPPGITTTVTVIQHETTIIYRDLTCTSARVFHVTAAQRLPNDDVYGKDAHQKIVGGSIQWRSRTGAPGYHEGQHVRKLTLKNGRLKADASFVGVVAPKGQVRVITLRLRLANGHHIILSRRVRLCLGKNGDMNRPPDIPQNGHTDPSTTGSAAIPARVALEPTAQ